MFKKQTLKLIMLFFLFLQTNTFVMAETISDDLVEQTLKGQFIVKPVIQKEIIKDNISAKDFKQEQLTKQQPEKSIIIDQTAIESSIHIKRPNGSYKIIDENADTVFVPVMSINLIKLNNKLIEGQAVNFKIAEDVKKGGGLFIKKDTAVEGIIETVTKASYGGDPAEIIVGRFITKDINGNKVCLVGEVAKTGLNLVAVKICMDSLGRLWWSVPPFSFPLAVLPYTKYLYRGGKAQIKPQQTFKLYYE